MTRKSNNLLSIIPCLVLAIVLLSGCAPMAGPQGPGPRDNLLGWYRMQDGRVIPVFTRSGTYYSACRGFEIPMDVSPQGLLWGHEPSSMTGTQIGRDPGGIGYYISLFDSQLAAIYEDYVPGQKQPLQKIDPPYDVPETTAAAPKNIDGFIGWYQPVWFGGIKLQVRGANGSYAFVTYYLNHQTGEWTNDKPEPLSPLRGGYPGLGKLTEPVSFIYNKSLDRYELIMEPTPTSMLRMPLVPIDPQAALPVPNIPIGIPSWN